MTFVLDGSVAISRAFADEVNSYTEAIVELLREDDAIVPGVWPLEIANATVVGQCLVAYPMRIESDISGNSCCYQFTSIPNR